MSAVAFKHRLAYRAQREARVALAAMQVPFETRDRRQVHRSPRVPVQRRREARQPPRGLVEGMVRDQAWLAQGAECRGRRGVQSRPNPRQLDVQRVEVDVEDALEELRGPRVG